MLVDESKIISIFKHYFLLRLLFRVFFVIDVAAFVFAPVAFFVILLIVHVVIGSFYMSSFVNFHTCFVYLK